MSGAPRRGAPLRWTAGPARAGIVAIGRGAALAALALAALIPLAALLVLVLTPVWGIWTAFTLDGVPQRRRFVEGLQPAGGGWFTEMVSLPTEAVRPIFGDGFFRAVCLFLTALALAVIPLPCWPASVRSHPESGPSPAGGPAFRFRPPTGRTQATG
jgi:hypothetical protein